MTEWKTRRLKVAELHLDSKNPRLGDEATHLSPREIVAYLFAHDEAFTIAESLAHHGYFQSEPLLTIWEDKRWVVVEGNRRLAAVKALLEPALLEGDGGPRIAALAKQARQDDLRAVPVTIAPSRKATDALVAGRHLGTPVRAWTAENRARFILDKLADGYTPDSLQEDLGFSAGDLQEARLVRAFVGMAKAMADDLSEDARSKIADPRSPIYTTMRRVFESTPGQEALHVRPDSEHGLVGTTSVKEFKKGFRKLIEDLASGRQTSRSLNKAEDIRKYFAGWGTADLPAKVKNRRFTPAEFLSGRKGGAGGAESPVAASPRQPPESPYVLPSTLRVVHGTPRMRAIRGELVKLDGRKCPNAGAVLLRVFLELTMTHFLERKGELAKLEAKLRGKGTQTPPGFPKMKDMIDELLRVAKPSLSKSGYESAARALAKDKAAQFSLMELHAFVHSHNDLPTAASIRQFWVRMEPMFRLMLEQP